MSRLWSRHRPPHGPWRSACEISTEGQVRRTASAPLRASECSGASSTREPSQAGSASRPREHGRRRQSLAVRSPRGFDRGPVQESDPRAVRGTRRHRSTHGIGLARRGSGHDRWLHPRCPCGDDSGREAAAIRQCMGLTAREWRDLGVSPEIPLEVTTPSAATTNTGQGVSGGTRASHSDHWRWPDKADAFGPASEYAHAARECGCVSPAGGRLRRSRPVRVETLPCSARRRDT